jgi:putative FmdB family regulatory protein
VDEHGRAWKSRAQGWFLMPIYEYAHEDDGCDLGKEFEHTQSIRDEALKVCPRCGRPVRRLISRTFVSTPQSNTELRDMGFTKLVKRDSGVYENVTRREGESRYMEKDKPETMPNLKKTISD